MYKTPSTSVYSTPDECTVIDIFLCASNRKTGTLVFLFLV